MESRPCGEQGWGRVPGGRAQVARGIYSPQRHQTQTLRKPLARISASNNVPRRAYCSKDGRQRWPPFDQSMHPRLNTHDSQAATGGVTDAGGKRRAEPSRPWNAWGMGADQIHSRGTGPGGPPIKLNQFPIAGARNGGRRERETGE